MDNKSVYVGVHRVVAQDDSTVNIYRFGQLILETGGWDVAISLAMALTKAYDDGLHDAIDGVNEDWR